MAGEKGERERECVCVIAPEGSNSSSLRSNVKEAGVVDYDEDDEQMVMLIWQATATNGAPASAKLKEQDGCG